MNTGINVVRASLLDAKIECENGGQFSHLITVVRLPSDAAEVIINTEEIPAKIDYLLEKYDENMQMHNVPAISIEGIMCVQR